MLVATESGVPLVLRIRALVDDRPFPTLYWLSSRELYKALSRLETEGWVGQLEAELAADEALMAAYQQNHRDYVARRWQLMRAEDRARIAELGFTELFDRYGIGGIAHWDRVRCLHMHYAHYLAAAPGERVNVIGELLEQRFGLRQLTIHL